MYSTIKFSHLITKHNPNISTYFNEDDMSEIAVNLNENKFKFAVTIENFHGEIKQKNDPKYVKYLFRKYGKR